MRAGEFGFGFRAHFGDATRSDLLISAGIERARLLVVAIDGKEQITALVTEVRKTWPDVHVLARAVDRNHVYDLWWAGCRDIVRETYDGSLRMGRSAFEALGTSRAEAEAIAQAFNALDRKAMLEAAEHYDPAIPALENAPYVAKVRDLNTRCERELGQRIAEILGRPL